MLVNCTALRVERASLQVHFAVPTEIPRGLQRPLSRQVICRQQAFNDSLMNLCLCCRYLAIKFQEMEEKLQKEKEEKEKEKHEEAEKVAAASDNQIKVEEIVSGSEDKPTDVESSTEAHSIVYTPGPIRVPTDESPDENLIPVSDLPPVPQTVVEQERLEMIEIKNDGTSGHLTHSLE